MNPEKKTDYLKLLLDMVPTSGETIGNATLRERLQKAVAAQNDELTEQDYWTLRDALIDQGAIERGRGRGGSVYRVKVEPAPEVPPEVVLEEARSLAKTEAELYDPFHTAITTGYVKDNRIKRFISEITASQGRRATGGKWTRPDLTLIAVRTYAFTPGKRLEVITFEVKPAVEAAFEGVYEALAHSAFAHRSYLAVDVREYEQEDDIDDDRIVQECSRFGLGYMTFTDVSDYNTYQIINTAKLSEPDPYEVDRFITTQVRADKQEEIREWLR